MRDLEHVFAQFVTMDNPVTEIASPLQKQLRQKPSLDNIFCHMLLYINFNDQQYWKNFLLATTHLLSSSPKMGIEILC